MSIRREVRDGVFFRFTDPPRPRGTLLYVHGLGESGLCFEPLLQHSDLQEWRQVAPDLPGYGKSDWVPRPLTLEELAEFVWRKTPHSRLPTILVGHSMGGVVGQYICELNARDFRGFVNVEGNLSLADCLFSQPSAELSTDEFCRTGFGQLADRVYQGGASDPPQRGYYASLRFCDPRAYHLNSLQLVDASGRQDLALRMASLPMPAIYIAGLRDRNGHQSVELLQQAGIRWEGWSDSGHWPFLDQTGRFVETLRAFSEGA